MCGTHTGGKGCGDDSVGLTDVVAVRGGRGAWSVDVFVAFLFPRGGCDDGGGAVERPAEGGKEREVWLTPMREARRGRVERREVGGEG
jgi:hypothetical protein